MRFDSCCTLSTQWIQLRDARSLGIVGCTKLRACSTIFVRGADPKIESCQLATEVHHGVAVCHNTNSWSVGVFPSVRGWPQRGPESSRLMSVAIRSTKQMTIKITVSFSSTPSHVQQSSKSQIFANQVPNSIVSCTYRHKLAAQKCNI